MNRDYEILGVQPGATPDEVKTAYKNLAKKHHPDKGGDPEKFKEINNAFERISNPDKNTNAEAFDDMARQFFGAGSPFSFFHPNPRMFKQVVDVRVHLEDLYRAKKLRVNNQDIVIPANCPLHKEIPVPGTNIILMVRHNKHPVFDVESHSYNLVYKQSISLCEALLGFQCKLKHPNGTMMFIKSPPNKVITNNMVLRAKGKGIPTLRGVLSDLLVMFEVEIPTNVDKEKHGNQIKEIFGFDVPDLVQTPSDILTLLE